MYYILYILLLFGGHLSCLQFLAVMSKAAILLHIILWIYAFLGVEVEVWVRYMSNCIRNCLIVI